MDSAIAPDRQRVDLSYVMLAASAAEAAMQIIVGGRQGTVTGVP